MALTSTTSWEIQCEWFNDQKVLAVKGDPRLIAVALRSYANNMPATPISNEEYENDSKIIADTEKRIKEHLLQVAREITGGND